jgi:predicted DNA-binding transcriptional regulator AlpA
MTAKDSGLGGTQVAACADLGREENLDYSDGNTRVVGIRTQLLDVRKVAEMLSCSERTVWRWRDEKLMPEPIVIGRVVRWSFRTIMAWIEAGCPKACDAERSV